LPRKKKVIADAKESCGVSRRGGTQGNRWGKRKIHYGVGKADSHRGGGRRSRIFLKKGDLPRPSKKKDVEPILGKEIRTLGRERKVR